MKPIRKHYFQVNEDLGSRTLARMYQLRENKNGQWYYPEYHHNSSEHRRNLSSAERAFSKIRIIESSGNKK
jgi:hypothetical protein